MLKKLLVFGIAVTLINTLTESSAQSTYEVYEAYPQANGQYQIYKTQDTQPLGRPQQTQTTYNQNSYQQYQTGQQPQYQYQTVQQAQQQYQTAQQPQQRYQTVQQTQQQQYQTVQQPQQQQYQPHNKYTEKSNTQVSATEAEWVCTNPKTNDMMIIAVDDSVGSRNNGPPQWHQVNPQNNQPNYVQPQPTFGDPTYTQQNSILTTTEKAQGPVWPNNNYQPTEPPVNPTTGTHTTTERERGPVWPSGEKIVAPTTRRPAGPIQGFTVEDTPTTRRPFQKNPFFDLTTQKPKTTTGTPDPNDEDGPIEIVMG